MSLRDKAREVREAGKAERGNFAPTGVPKRAYQWWLKESNSKRARRVRNGTQKENFCHFWRVVLFWAPLRKLAYGLGHIAPFLGILAVIAAVALFIFALVNDPQDVLGFIAGIAALILLAGGILAGISAGMSERQRRRNDMITDKRALTVLGVLGFPTFIVFYLATRGVRFYGDHLTKWNKPIGITAASLAFLAVVFAVGAGAGWSFVASLALAILIAAVGLVFIILVIVQVADFVSGKRAIAKAKAEDRKAVYVAEHGHLPVKKPGIVSKFFSGVGDFIVLIAQVVRTKKWKICPFVEIDDDEKVAA